MGADFVIGLLAAGQPRVAEDPAGDAALVRFHLLEGLCVARARASGLPLLPADLLGEMEPAYRTQGLLTTLVVETAHRARGVLGEASIPSVLFKGAALVADGTYADPGSRRMDDADLLVPPEAALAAVEALMDAGFRPVTPWDPATVAWSDAVTLHDAEAPPGTTAALDLHWRTGYDRLRFGGERPSVLWVGADADTGFPAPEPHLVLAGEHLLKHLRFKTHLAAYGDLARLAGRVTDWDRVAALTGESRLSRGIRALLGVVQRDLGAPVPGGVWRGAGGRAGAGHGRLSRELAPAALVGRRRPVEGRLAGIAHRWRLLGSPGRVMGDVVEAAFPPGRWLQARYGRTGVQAWLRYVADVMRWAVYRGRSPASPNQDLFDPRGRE
jgi:hypothetical protein